MNKIYSKVWNKELGQLVVASELASSDSTGAAMGAGRGQALRMNALALTLLAAGWHVGAQATVVIDGTTPIVNPGGSGITCAQPAAGSVWTCQIPRAGGGFATITGIAGADGAAAITAAKNWAITNLTGTNAIVLGNTSTKAVVAGTAKNADGAVAIGDGAEATESSVAVGVRAKALDLTSTAVGFETLADGLYAVALGSGAQAIGDRAYALGNNALARTGDVAVGAGALYKSELSAGAELAGKVGETTAVGYNAGLGAKDVYRSTFIGSAAGAYSEGELNSFIGNGTGASTVGNRNAFFGNNAGAQSVGNLNVAGGNLALAGAQGSNNVGQGTGAGAVVVGDSNVAIGDRAGTQTFIDANGDVDTTKLVPSFYSNAINIGTQTKALANNAVAIGSGASTNIVGAVALGSGSVANTDANVAGYDPLTGLASTDKSATWVSTLAAVSVGSTGNTRQITNVAAGTLDTDAVNVAQLKAGQTHYFSVNDAAKILGSGNYNNDGATGLGAIAVGTNAAAAGNLSVALGFGATAGNRESIAIGWNATSAGGSEIHIGTDSGIGGSSKNVTNIGIGIRTGQNVTGVSNTTMGWQSGNQVTGDLNVGLGRMAGTGVVGSSNTAVGAYTGQNITGKSNIAIGDNAGNNVSANDTLAIGTGAHASANDGLAIGRAASTTTVGGVALGAGSVANTVAGISGYDPITGLPSTNTSAIWVSTLGAVSVGSAGNTRQITNVAAGALDTDAVNVAQLKALAGTVEANEIHYFSVNDNGVAGGNYDNKGATGINATAIGVNSTATGEGATAVGMNTTADVWGVAIGRDAKALTNIGGTGGASVAIGLRANAQGDGSDSTGNNAAALAIGADANATADGAIALGESSKATAYYATTVGQYAGANAKNSTALGGKAQASVEGSVALGANSIANTAAGAVGYDPVTGLPSTETSATWVSTLGAVSVGSAGNTRQITNVAAGTVDTDAVNVAQLKAVNAAATAGWNVADKAGNTANIGPDGKVTFQTGNANLTVAQTGADDAGVVDITLSNTLDLGAGGSVTTGKGKLDDSGLTVDDGAGNTTTTGVAGTTVTNAGGLTTSVGAGVVSVGDGTVANTTVINPTGVAVGGANPLNISGVTGTITGLTNTTLTDPTFATAGRAATEEQLSVVNATASKGWNVTTAQAGTGTAVGTTVTAVLPGDTATFVAGNNIEITQAGKNLTIATSLTPSFTSVTTGNTVMNNAGISIVGGPNGTVSLTNTGLNNGGNTITNVAAGVNLTDAVNVSQLTALGNGPLSFTGDSGKTVTRKLGETLNVVGGATGTLTDNNISVVTNDTDTLTVKLAEDIDLGAGGSVKMGDALVDNTGLMIAGGPSITTAGINAGGLVITNVADGVADSDAVNVSQLRDTVGASKNKYYSVNSKAGGNEANDGATGADAIASGKDAEAAGDEAVAMGLGASAAGEGSVALGAGAQALQLNSLAFGAGAVAWHANSIAMGAGSATTVGAQASYTGAYVGNSSSTGEMNVGGRQITGVAAGSAATDAVNVSQLQGGVNTAITESKTYTDTQISNVNAAITNLDNRVTSIEGDIIDIQGDITDIRGDIIDIQGDITNLDDRVTTVEGDVDSLTNTVSEFGDRITKVESGADGMFQVSQESPITKPQPTGTNSSAGGNGASAGGNNALAVGNQSNASGNNSTAIGTGATASAANSTAIGQGATASHANSVALGQGSATTVGAQTNYNAAYVGTSTSKGEVNMGGRTITGVAPGIAGTDVVNVNQLNGGVNHAINMANQYTDGQITSVRSDMWQMQRDFRGATSSAMAMAGLPQAYLPGKSMVAVGFGGYQGEYGMAFGLSGITENGRYVYKAQASGNTSRDWGFSVGAGLQW